MSLFPKKSGSKLRTDVDKTPLSESLIAHESFTPNAVSATGVKTAIALTSGAQTGVTAGITNPDVPRNVTVKGNASGITGNVVVHGTNINGDTISDTIALNGATEVAGVKAFKTVTSVDYPAETHAGTDTVSIGLGGKLGLKHKLPTNTVIAAAYNKARESTAPVVAVHASNIDSNTILLNSSLAGAQVDYWYIV